ncbi:thioredoxin family protein [Dyadobacter sandarakinus]|uniref:Thioredoxin family protein n=1 Tax=Dyadobacter sandarakinus TaxID=2747268 RepID=A0ABX7I2R8_9BACT|nr:thioredoxin family protein [Dyadobacter sandarakinus]QRQ99816.1 thioredoxin family protein [Dyadobacter sandarakinus]
MTFQEYSQLFKSIVDQNIDAQAPPYDNPKYFEYTRLNWQRMNRWLKVGRLLPGLSDTIGRLNQMQTWTIITEPWCGDAAHNVPFLEMAARNNPLITITYELRDSEPFRIQHFLTHGSKSIPKLIISDAGGKTLATWGPRPADCQKMHSQLSAENAPFEQVAAAIQVWYNANKGIDLQEELQQLLEQVARSAPSQKEM